MTTARRRRAAIAPCLGPLASWFASRIDLVRFRDASVGRASAVLAPRDSAHRMIVPDFAGSLDLARSGLPFHAVLERDHDRSPDSARVDRLLAEGRTIFLVQPHQVLPRLARLIVAIRAAFLGPFRNPCSFLFLAGGDGREGMGLHHDGNVDSFWLQIEGRRTVTFGPPVSEDTPEDMNESSRDPSSARPVSKPPRETKPESPRRRMPGYRTLALEPGSLLYMPPRTPHRVVCFERSLAVSLTFPESDPRDAIRTLVDDARFELDAALDPLSPAPIARLLDDAGTRIARSARDPIQVQKLLAAGLAAWDVARGSTRGATRRDANRLWFQRPVVAGAVDRRSRTIPLFAGDGMTVRVPASAASIACDFVLMPSLHREAIACLGRSIGALVESGLVAFHDLPLRIEPDDLDSLDGWNFA
ncbi:MAG: cupin-like domain-containing protein [Planctomycetes bacterium]|nr:cupin-like domain-containing protein [Planctomycetota bacterium]MBI3848366.1 cupin-like domain-containing protein [Planctomycetota bacterium]